MMSLRGLNPEVRARAEWTLAVAGYYGVPVQVTSTLRSWESQQALRTRYEACLRSGQVGQPGPCRYPANRPGDSSHQYGLSWDSVVDPVVEPWWVGVRRYAGFEIFDHDKIHAQVPSWRQYV